MTAISLQEAFARVPDPRSRHGRQYPLPAILCLLTVSLLVGRRSVAAACRLLDDYGGALALALGFRHAKIPCPGNLSTLLRRLDAAAVEAALAGWVRQQLRAAGRVADHLAMDGKVLRGSRDGELPGVHLLSAFAPQLQATLGQLRVAATANEYQAALALWGVVPGSLAGVVVTGDAIFCQKEVCRSVRSAGGDYVLVVKDNQPGLKADIEAGLSFAAAAATFSPDRHRRAGGPTARPLGQRARPH